MNKVHLAGVLKFGRELLRTNDLDPVFIALHDSGMNFRELRRFILAYTCLHHLGGCARLASYNSDAYWTWLQIAAEDQANWPRSADRRHWHGDASRVCVRYLRDNYKKPEHVVDYWLEELTFPAIRKRVTSFPQYGDWAAFKVADLGNRVLGLPVSFEGCELGFYKDPRKGAALVFTGDMNAKITDGDVGAVVERLQHELRGFKAPPRYERSINVQEVETILCKYKSSVNKSYYLGKDTVDFYEQLGDFKRWGPVAKRMRAALEPLQEHWTC